MSYEQSLAGVTWVITRHDAQPRREEGERGRQGGHAECVDACAAAPTSNQALQEEARDPLSTLTEGCAFSSALIRHQRTSPRGGCCRREKAPVPFCTQGTREPVPWTRHQRPLKAKGAGETNHAFFLGVAAAHSAIISYCFI